MSQVKDNFFYSYLILSTNKVVEGMALSKNMDSKTVENSSLKDSN